MPSFSYYGRDTKNQPIHGVLEAASTGNVADTLLGIGITPVRIEPERIVTDARETIGRWFGRGRINAMDLLLFTRQMHTLARSGVPILRALAGLEESSHSAPLSALLRELRQSLDSGLELSQAMSKRADVFDAFYVSMIQVGESTGKLEEVLNSLHDHYEFQKYMREQVKSALRYPSFVVAAMLGAVVVINIVVIPAFAKVFEGLRTELPLMTRLLLGSSRFMLRWWPLLAAVAVGGGYAVRQALRIAPCRLWWDRCKLSLPIVGTIVRKGVLSRATRSLALVLQSGVPLVQGLSLAAQVVENAYIGGALREMRVAVEHGDSLLSCARRAGIFTPIVLQMVMVGEESGTLAEMLDEVGQMYQRELEYELKTLSQHIEPILIVALGAMVLVLALGVFMPMWEMGSKTLK